MKRSILNGIFTFFGILFFIGCSTQNNQIKRNELWYDIGSIDNLIGKWEGYRSVDIPKNEENLIPKTSIEISISLEYIKGSKEVNVSMKIDLNRFLNDWLNIEEIKETGITKNELWEILFQEFEKIEGYTIGGRYYINYDLSDNAETFLSNNSDGEFKINDTCDKIKLIFYKAMSFGLGDSGFNEMILQKK